MALVDSCYQGGHFAGLAGHLSGVFACCQIPCNPIPEVLDGPLGLTGSVSHRVC